MNIEICTGDAPRFNPFPLTCDATNCAPRVYLWNVRTSADASHAERRGRRDCERQQEAEMLRALLPDDCQLRHTADGRPFLASPVRERLPYLSISHTRDVIAFALMPATEHETAETVGVDVERITHRTLCIAERFCTPREMAYIQSQPSDEAKHKASTVLWCLKEAAFKAFRDNADLFLHDLEVRHADAEGTCLIANTRTARLVEGRIYIYGTLVVALAMQKPLNTEQQKI